MPVPHVLIVDDDAALLQALPEALQLRLEPIRVDISDSAQSALEQIAAIDYDAIITDIKMPGMDGLALLDEIHVLRPDTPTLLITGHGEHDLVVRALRGGAYDFIPKPIDRDYFVAALRRAMQFRHLRRQVEQHRQTLEQYASELEHKVQERTHDLLAANEAREQSYHRAQEELGERRRAEEALARHKEQIEALNKRLQRLVTDTHHRVKNNLQILTSMVELQLLDGEAMVPIAELRRLQTTIKTLANLHDLLTEDAKGEELAELHRVKPMLETLVPLFQSLSGAQIHCEFGDAVLSSKKMTSLSLLVNELVSNAYKHGNGSITVRFAAADTLLTLIVEDDGPGFPSDFDPQAVANTGLELIHSFASNDLRGQVSFENCIQGGGRVVVTFPTELSLAVVSGPVSAGRIHGARSG